MTNDPRFEVNIGASLDAEPAERVDDGTFSIAILGDFSARAHRSHRGIAEALLPLGRRKGHSVDRDDVDDVISRLGPRLQLTLVPGEPPVTIGFESLEDFHPDKLVERVPLLQQLRELREETESGSASASRPAPRPAMPPSRRADAAALTLGSGSLLDRIVDSDPSAGDDQQIRGVAPQDDLADFVDRAVRPHTVSTPTHDQQAMLTKIDETIAATMRVLLHHPDFQALESLWRGVDFLVRRLDTSESLKVYLVDVTRDDLIGNLDSPGPLPWTMLVGAFSFGPGDVGLLARIATFARGSGAPFVAAADPRLAGTASFGGDPDPDEWQLPLPSDWDSLRSSPSASFLSLSMPRFLLRMPYGKRTDPCEVVKFEEMPEGTREHESYLWGNPALLTALAIGESAAEGDRPATQAVFEGFPLHTPIIDGEPTITPAGEALLTQRAVTRLLDRGLTPLETSRDGDTIRLSRVQSVASPPRQLSIPNYPS